KANAAAARKLRRAFTGPSVKRFAGGVNDAGDSADLLTPCLSPAHPLPAPAAAPARRRRRLRPVPRETRGLTVRFVGRSYRVAFERADRPSKSGRLVTVALQGSSCGLPDR